MKRIGRTLAALALALCLAGEAAKESAPVLQPQAAPAKPGVSSNVKTPAAEKKEESKPTDKKPVSFDLLGVFGRSRVQSNESAAIGNLRTIVGAETAFYAANKAYGSITMLTGATPAYLDGDWKEPRQGYKFLIRPSINGNNFTATAVPVTPGESGNRSFFADASGVIRFADAGEKPSAASRPIGG